MANQTESKSGYGKKQPQYAETQPARRDLKEQRGGPQSDQRVGETDKGAHNQEAKGRNPQGNKSERPTDR